MSDPENEAIEKTVRRAAGISALRKIGKIVAAEQQADAEKTIVLRWLARYGLIFFLGGALMLAYFMGVF